MLVNDRLAHPDYPAYMFEDFTAFFSRTIFPSMNCPLPGKDLLRNTIERILITETEEF